MKIDTSDDATGLPPMRVAGPDDEPAAVVLAGESVGTGIVTIPGTDETVAVRFLYLRCVLLNDAEEPEWIQRNVAIPVELVPAVVAALKSA